MWISNSNSLSYPAWYYTVSFHTIYSYIIYFYIYVSLSPISINTCIYVYFYLCFSSLQLDYKFVEVPGLLVAFIYHVWYSQ